MVLPGPVLALTCNCWGAGLPAAGRPPAGLLEGAIGRILTGSSILLTKIIFLEV